MLKRLLAVALVGVLAGCADGVSDPTAVTPSLSTQGAVYGPVREACLPTDFVVSEWSSPDPAVVTLEFLLNANVVSAGKVIGIEGMISVPPTTPGYWVRGITLTCVTPGSGLLIENGVLSINAGSPDPLTVQGLTIEGLLRLYGGGFKGAVVVARNAFRGGQIPFSAYAFGPGSDVSYNYFEAGSLGVAAFLLDVEGMHFHHNSIISQGEPMARFGALQVQLAMTGMSITDNHFHITRPAGPPFRNSAIALRGLGTRTPNAFATIANNQITGPWGHSLETSGRCDIDWTGNRLDGGDLTADIYLGPGSCRNYTRTRLERPQGGWVSAGPAFRVIDLGTDNTILGAALIKVGTYAAPPPESINAFCPTGRWDEGTETCVS